MNCIYNIICIYSMKGLEVIRARDLFYFLFLTVLKVLLFLYYFIYVVYDVWTFVFCSMYNVVNTQDI
jgi:hypothetical protein